MPWESADHTAGRSATADRPQASGSGNGRPAGQGTGEGATDDADGGGGDGNGATDDPSTPAPGIDDPSKGGSTPEPDPGPPPAGPALLAPGDNGPQVREVQARLKQIDWFSGDVTDHYGDATAEAVRGFQAKRGFEATGEVDQRTLDRLEEMTTEPTSAELTNTPPAGTGSNTPGPLDPRCQTGRVLCIDKTTRTLRWVVDGDVRKTVDVRFGSAELPTREGEFSVERKSRDHVSSLYDTPMPFAMFFSGGQAVHYSPDFAATGYNGASHGCVNVRDHDAVAWLFDQVALGDRVIIYWS
ncbi:murein L,D-transpeptidase [Nocardioides caeni]|uniref:Murein L,D-transpeptidase n=2 Tax=Nocardioides caeni TaxID=574700 RepID=A0A4S8NDD3_9ACTN|nr:murein L,D-transpeptidase [Nocardioides caeni]